MTDPTAAVFTPAALRAAAADLDDRAEVHRRAANRCRCSQPGRHNQVAEELAMIAAVWRTRALKAELAARAGGHGGEPPTAAPSPTHPNPIEGVTR